MHIALERCSASGTGLVHESGHERNRVRSSPLIRLGSSKPRPDSRRHKTEHNASLHVKQSSATLPRVSFPDNSTFIIMIAAAVSLKALPARAAFAQGSKKVAGVRCGSCFLGICQPNRRSGAPTVRPQRYNIATSVQPYARRQMQ